MRQVHWSWATGTPRERADMVRGHAFGCHPLPEDQLYDLFLLTNEGLARIKAGDGRRPEYALTGKGGA